MDKYFGSSDGVPDRNGGDLGQLARSIGYQLGAMLYSYIAHNLHKTCHRLLEIIPSSSHFRCGNRISDRNRHHLNECDRERIYRANNLD